MSKMGSEGALGPLARGEATVEISLAAIHCNETGPHARITVRRRTSLRRYERVGRVSAGESLLAVLDRRG